MTRVNLHPSPTAVRSEATSSFRWPGVLAVTLLPLLIIGIAWLTTPHTELNNGLETDGVYYLAMAKRVTVDPVLSHTAPMAYRVLTPFLANLFPFTKLAGFSVLGFLSLWATLALLYAVLRRSGVSRAGSALGVVLYAGVFWAVKYAFFSPALVDFQTQLFLVGVAYLVMRRWWWAIGPAIALGVAQKESILAMAVVAGTYYVMKRRPEPAWKTAGVVASFVLPGAAVYVVLRAVITPLKSYPSGIGLMMSQAGFWGAHPTRWPVLLLAVFSGLGVLPVLALALRRDILARWRDNLHWLAMIGIGAVLLLGGLAKSRLFLYMLPAVVVMVAQGLDRRLASRAWIGIMLVLHVALGNWLSPVGRYETYLRHLNPEFSLHLGAEPYIRVLAILAVAVAITVAFRRELEPATETR